MKTIRTSNAELIENAHFSSLSSTGTGSTLSVYSIADFAVDQVLLLGEFGQEGSEIVHTHAGTAPTGTTVTLASALTKSHPKDTKVYILPYNQVEFSHATTTTGDKTVISTSDVNEESMETLYNDSAYSSGYYFIRFKNSITNAYSDYSDPIPYGGFATNTVGYMVELVMKEMKKEFNDVLTYQTVLDEINSCLRYVKGKLKTWSNVQEFNYVLGQMTRGEYSWSLPTTYYDKNSDRSMLQVRVGTSSALTYKDKIEFDEHFEDVAVSQVATQGEVGALALALDSTDDFPSSGTVHYYISNTLYSVEFTANDKDTNTLTTEALTVTTPVDTNVWYGESESTPEYFSIWDGNLYIWPLCGSTNYGKNIYLDFYTDIVEVDSDADEITLARHDMIKHWIKWQIRNITENNGKMDFQNGDWIMFTSILADSIRRESSGQKRKMIPRINAIYYRGEQGSRNSTFENQ